jgi:putative membrane protein
VTLLAGDASWHRLHPLSPLVRAGRQFMSLAVVLIGISALNQHPARSDIIIDLAVLGLALVAGFVSWLVTRWQVADGVLRIDTGLIRRDSRRIPLSQVQAVDIVQSGLARVLGLAELQLRVAGGDSSRSGRLACLRRADAEQLRRQLLALAAASAVASAAAGPSRTLFRVRAGRLFGAVLLTRSGATAVVVAVATFLTVQLTGSARTVAPFLPVVLGVVAALWRQFNGEYGTTVTAAQDGIRLRSGPIQTTAETIRPGRVQAVRLVEPLVWRAFGWCRLEVDVAGSRERRENQSEGRRHRALIPVGSRADADQMLAELMPSHPLPTRPAPSRARRKAPLSYHFLAWSGDDRYVVASTGRICRETTWVPLQKVQSVRWVQGPLQRQLGLATLHLDAAGKRVGARIQDRDSAEALEILGTLPDLARAARSSGLQRCENDDVAEVVTDGGVEGATASDEPELSVGNGAVDGRGRKSGLREHVNGSDLEHG